MIVSNTTYESHHLMLLKNIFEKIRRSGMTLKFSKCEFICSKRKFQGYMITPSHICMDPTKLKTVSYFPYHRNKKQLQSFISFCNYHHKFSDRHASHMSLLIELLKNKSW